jgi:hypothetical protein
MSANTKPSAGTSWAAGAIFFAGVMLLLAGAAQAAVGLVALFNDTFYVVGQKWVFQFDITAWGWIHLGLGALLFLVGIFVLRGALWSSIAGIVIASISALASFAWLPYFPVWAILVIAVDVLIIWALATHRTSIKLLDS